MTDTVQYAHLARGDSNPRFILVLYGRISDVDDGMRIVPYDKLGETLANSPREARVFDPAWGILEGTGSGI